MVLTVLYPTFESDQQVELHLEYVLRFLIGRIFCTISSNLYNHPVSLPFMVLEEIRQKLGLAQTLTPPGYKSSFRLMSKILVS